MATTKCIWSCRHVQGDLLKISIVMGKKDNLSDFKHSVADPARPAGLRISEQGFSLTMISIYRACPNKRKCIASKPQFSLADASVQRRMPSLL